ncbi:hypothetical protein MTP04_24660 [Lysinibacillus sp. PLM2]|nr:hypothetical protein MTP04_24660 [Lysinibacillus sp. PLM2]
MQVLKVLSDIWKSGAEMNLLDSGEIELKHHERVPAEVMKVAQEIFPQIEEWFKSWKDASKVDITMRKIIHHFCGWQMNDTLNKWLCEDLEYLWKFDEWMKMLDRNGWKDIYVDYRQFQTEESNKLAKEIYERAIAYVKRGA